MSDNTDDSDYIDQKSSEKDSTNSSNGPNFIGFFTTIISDMIKVIILFVISSGIIANVNNPKYRQDGNPNGNLKWAGSDINGPPYVCNSKSGGGAQLDGVKKNFNLNECSFPYNLPDVRKILSLQKKLDVYNKSIETSENPGNPPDVESLDPQASLIPWAIRMTALSYSWMRGIFEKLILSLIPTNSSKYSNMINNIIFLFGWFPLLTIFFLMFFIAPIMTLTGALFSFKPWAWVGSDGLMQLFTMFIIPGFLYCMGLFVVPIITAFINHFIQPFFYLGFMFEPLFTNFEGIKNTFMSNGSIIAYVGILITIISSIQNFSEAPGYIFGVIIMSFIAILGLNKDKIKELSNKLMKKE